jgi:hypothetical protein
MNNDVIRCGVGAVAAIALLAGCGSGEQTSEYPATPTFESSVGQEPAYGTGMEEPGMEQPPETQATPTPSETEPTPMPESPSGMTSPSDAGDSTKLCGGLAEVAVIKATKVPGGMVLDITAIDTESKADLDTRVSELQTSLNGVTAGSTDEAAAEQCPLVGLKQQSAIMSFQKVPNGHRIVIQPKQQKDMEQVAVIASELATEPAATGTNQGTQGTPGTPGQQNPGAPNTPPQNP